MKTWRYYKEIEIREVIFLARAINVKIHDTFTKIRTV